MQYRVTSENLETGEITANRWENQAREVSESHARAMNRDFPGYHHRVESRPTPEHFLPVPGYPGRPFSGGW
jgi:hypothetical protein